MHAEMALSIWKALSVIWLQVYKNSLFRTNKAALVRKNWLPFCLLQDASSHISKLQCVLPESQQTGSLAISSAWALTAVQTAAALTRYLLLIYSWIEVAGRSGCERDAWPVQWHDDK